MTHKHDGKNNIPWNIFIRFAVHVQTLPDLFIAVPTIQPSFSALSLYSFYLPYVSLPPLTSLSTLVLGACTHLRVPTHTYYRALQQLALFHPPPTLTPSTPAPPHSSDASKRSSQIPVAGVGQACSPPYSPRFIFSSLL